MRLVGPVRKQAVITHGDADARGVVEHEKYDDLKPGHAVVIKVKRQRDEGRKRGENQENDILPGQWQLLIKIYFLRHALIYHTAHTGADDY